jgi:hypothetical protein
MTPRESPKDLIVRQTQELSLQKRTDFMDDVCAVDSAQRQRIEASLPLKPHARETTWANGFDEPASQS